MGMKIGIVGCGSFCRSFIRLFQAHPGVDKMVLCDLDIKKAKEKGKMFGIDQFSESLDALLKTDVDAVAIFTQNWLHGPQARQALLAGKHVYSAVPMGLSIEEIEGITDAAKRTGMIYMLGETDYYHPPVIYARQQYRKGVFGSLVHVACNYYHDWDHGLYDVFRWRGKEKWKEVAGSPPMHYPTHSICVFVSVTGARLTCVSCQGFVDTNEDGYGLYGKGKNRWDNPFSNETALFSASDGSSVRVNEYRRIGPVGANNMCFYGTQGTFEAIDQGDGERYVLRTKKQPDPLFLQDLLACKPHPHAKKEAIEAETMVNFAKIHDVSSLPDTLQTINSGHGNSHNFLVHDFVQSCISGKLPVNHAWAAARYNIPGIVAHESAKKGGQLLTVPDLGDPPRDG